MKVGRHMQNFAYLDVCLVKCISNLYVDVSPSEFRIDIYAFYSDLQRQSHRVFKDFQHEIDVRNLGIGIFAGELQVGEVRAALEQRSQNRAIRSVLEVAA